MKPDCSNSGYVYVLLNPSMQGLVKIGKTARDPAMRVSELSSETGIATPFLLAYTAFFPDCSKAEQFIHMRLEEQGFRVSKHREFFKMPVEEAVRAVVAAQKRMGTDSQESETTEITQSPDEMCALLEGHALAAEGDRFYYGYGDTFRDYGAAFRLYKQAALLGDTDSYQKLGEMCEKGEGCRRDSQQALQYYEKGAAAGLLECYRDMSTIFLNRNETDSARKCWQLCFGNPQFGEHPMRVKLAVDYLMNVRKLFFLEFQTQLLSLKREIVQHLKEAITIVADSTLVYVDGQAYRSFPPYNSDANIGPQITAQQYGKGGSSDLRSVLRALDEKNLAPGCFDADPRPVHNKSSQLFQSTGSLVALFFGVLAIAFWVFIYLMK